MSLLAPTMQAFFTDRLVNQKDASPRTIAAYRDTMRLLLTFASQRTGKPPSRLDIDDLDAPLIGAFLDHLEHERGNSPRTRNARLAAIHSLYRYSALRHPEHAHTIARVIEIPTKRHDRTIVSYLEQHEIKALLAAPDRTTWLGRRDHALLLVAIQTGLRVSELAGLRIEHVRLDTGTSVKVTGKGRKQRVASLTPGTITIVRAWLKERQGHAADPVFPTRQGRPLTPKAIAWLLDKHTNTAAIDCPSLASKRVTPHTLRHTNAMLLLAENDIATVALWLGTRASNRRRFISTPTTRSSRKRSKRSRPPAPRPADTSHQTSSSRSSKPCNYQKPLRPRTPYPQEKSTPSTSDFR